MDIVNPWDYFTANFWGNYEYHLKPVWIRHSLFHPLELDSEPIQGFFGFPLEEDFVSNLYPIKSHQIFPDDSIPIQFSGRLGKRDRARGSSGTTNAGNWQKTMPENITAQMLPHAFGEVDKRLLWGKQNRYFLGPSFVGWERGINREVST